MELGLEPSTLKLPEFHCLHLKSLCSSRETQLNCVTGLSRWLDSSRLSPVIAMVPLAWIPRGFPILASPKRLDKRLKSAKWKAAIFHDYMELPQCRWTVCTPTIFLGLKVCYLNIWLGLYTGFMTMVAMQLHMYLHNHIHDHINENLSTISIWHDRTDLYKGTAHFCVCECRSNFFRCV